MSNFGFLLTNGAQMGGYASSAGMMSSMMATMDQTIQQNTNALGAVRQYQQLFSDINIASSVVQRDEYVSVIDDSKKYDGTSAPSPFMSGCSTGSYSYYSCRNGFNLLGRTSHPKGMLYIMACTADSFETRRQRINKWLSEHDSCAKNIQITAFGIMQNAYSGKPIYKITITYHGTTKTLGGTMNYHDYVPSPLGVYYMYKVCQYLDPTYFRPEKQYFNEQGNGHKSMIIPCLDDSWISELMMYFANATHISLEEGLHRFNTK